MRDRLARCGVIPWIAMLLALVWCQATFAEKRVALVIGNSAYVHAPALANPKNDAAAMAEALARLKFEVTLAIDLDKAGMEQKLGEFGARIAPGGVSLVFFAGHSVLTKDGVFLIPVEAKIEAENDVPAAGLALDAVLRLAPGAKAPPPATRSIAPLPPPGVRIVLVDGDLDNPFADGGKQAALRPLTAERTFVGYATLPGGVALDGEGKNSPYTAALVKHIETPGLEIHRLLARVAAEVETASKGRQAPWIASSLTADFYFAPPEPPPDPKR